MLTTIFQSIVRAYLRSTFSFAVGMATLAILTTPVSAGEHETSILEYCKGYVASPPVVSTPEFAVNFGTNGAIKAFPGTGGTPDITFPPSGGSFAHVLNFHYTYWTGSTWFCYKIAGVRKCIQY